MKTILIIISLCLFSGVVYSQKNKAIFLMHSTGTGVYSEGKVSDWIKTYNSANKTDFQITTRAYPNTPWPWENYPYDYWKLWVDNSCDNSDPDIECLTSLASNYGLVIFKHCFPGAGIGADTGKPDVKSKRKSLENYKLQYRALRTLMDGMPDKKFMVWTLVPLHRLATDSGSASRANEFVNWVKSQWLTEDGKAHPNIFIFDFFNLAAEMNASPANGKQYCLKYDYEGSHTSDDSHPNILANQTIGPLFAQAVVKALAANLYVTNISINSQNGGNAINTNKGTLQLQASVLPADATTKTVRWSVLNGLGQAAISASGLLTAQRDGTVTAVATATDGSGIKGELLITISNQIIPVESISITDNIKNDTISGIGAKINLKISVLPQDATNSNVDWIVENITGKASIDKNGVLITISPGLIKVIAKTMDQSNVQSFKEYKIVFPVVLQQHIITPNYKLYPNPAKGIIQISVAQMPTDGVIIEIRNYKGQVLMKKMIFENLSEWPLDQYASSIYFVTIIDKNKVFTQKIVNSLMSK